MKNILLTFSTTSLLWTAALLYCFAVGKLEHRQPDYLDELSAQPVHLTAHRG